eukprot:CAMPEP_0179426938 /NCGR_PEP_ID=MMETSP0799-20121207/13064_1 /TAXON_ID=46947 /ORGANISM="Geminigera cryophila, Strain CCMP2564" /LENGTH=33 /DNA_ID= /DNA_START= /DNA_END= /DNA_ORIENTATION=
MTLCAQLFALVASLCEAAHLHSAEEPTPTACKM